ncbi:MAG: DUF4838 domain-containing protein, partial [Victivallales bacterium]|nr:DUF4838 domain-containing protein [Victivallales bacterium]
MKKSLLLFLIMGLPLWAGVVIDAGRPPKIVVAEDAVPVAKYAASELTYFLGKMLGVEVGQAAQAEDGVRIYVGVGPDGKRVVCETYDSHIIVRSDGTIYIYGYETDDGSVNELRTIMNARNKGTLEAAYTFLEECIGVRWLEPGVAGEYVPKRKNLELPEMERTLSPTYRERRLFYLYMLQWFNKKNRPPDYEDYGDGDDFQRWIIRLRYTGSKTRVNGCHTPSIMDFEKNLYPQHPELFALQADGTRNWRDMCWSSQATKDFWWEVVDAYFQRKPLPYSLRLPWQPWELDEFMIDPHDYGKDYFCTCPTCSAFLKKYGDNGFGECIFQTIADVARRVEAKYPDKYITTLVYSPKKMYPESVELPRNLRVRMTVRDNAICSDQTFADKEIQLMRRWREQQGNKLRLWMYILFDFGGRLHGVPEFASTNFVNFLKKAAPYADGVFYEHIEPNHTMRNIDIYLIYHSLWNIDYDIDEGRREFFRLGYGAAADDMLAFYSRVERNSDAVMKTMIAHPEERPHAVAHKLRKRVFNTIYTFDELEALQKMLDDARAKVPKGSIEAKRIMRYEKHVLEPARQEFIIYSDDKVHAFRQQLPLYCLRTDDAPTEKEWDAAPWIEMSTASPDVPVNVKSLVKFISARDAFHVRARFEEPHIAKSRTTDEGNKLTNIWDDNETELFFASENLDKVVQVGINDKGVAVVHDVDSHTFRKAGDEVKAMVKRENSAWTLTAVFDNSLTGFSQRAVYDKFNMIRARNVVDLPSEYHTLNPECVLGKWNIPAFYSMVRRVERNPLEMKYKGRGMPVSEGKTTVLVDDAVASIDKWSDWVTPPGMAVFGRDEKV